MQKYLIVVFLNLNFWKADDDKIETFYKTIASNFMNLAYPSISSDEYRPFVRKTDALPILNRYAIKTMQSTYTNSKSVYKKQILLFLSIYDIHPNIKKAVRYIDDLQKIGFTIYIFSLDPERPFSQYRDKYLEYNGILSVIDRRDRHEKYNKCLLDFAVDLRRGDPVTYDIIKQITGIPKSTLISYMQRNHIELNHRTGRHELTEEELSTLTSLYNSGIINSSKQ